jgi:hypothetical protein
VYISIEKSCYFDLTYIESTWQPPLNRVPCFDGDNFVFRLYVKFDSGSWTYADRWCTEAIWNTAGKGVRYVEPFTWTIKWYVECKKLGATSYARFYCGGTTPSAIENMHWTYGENEGEGSFMRSKGPDFNAIEFFKKLSG